MNKAQFKVETEIDGILYGPFGIVDDSPAELVPYDPTRKVEWISIVDAIKLSGSAGLKLEIV